MGKSYKTNIASARRELDQARRALAVELRDYPTPVSGCDLQYTHLLREYQKVNAAVRALGAAPFIPTPRTLSPGSGVESR